MNLSTGQTLLHYRLMEKLGEGGMGVVWRATDTTLDREVAIKVLPAAFAADADRLARFEREAKLLATLNHPNIAAVYSVHSVGDLRFLAMEYVEGEDLAQRLNHGSFPVEQALAIAVQVAEAIETAHDSGVIHRDLKPANIQLTHEGKVKVLDFGLAKAMAGDSGMTSADPALSPTMTSGGGPGATLAGTLLGTAAYMSPEQARGHAADRRADNWAFGCVLYELLTGVGPFAGATVTDVLAAVIRKEPDWDTLPEELPRGVRRVLRHCLAKDLAHRLRDIGDARWELEHLETDNASIEAVAATPPVGPRRIPWLLGAFALALAAGVAGYFAGVAGSSGTQVVARESMRLDLVLPDDAPLAAGSFLPAMALTPDGRTLVYVGVRDGVRRLFARAMGDARVRELPETEGAEGPFVSPDGQSVGFFADMALRKTALSGAGIPKTLVRIRDFRGATWGADDVIVFAGSQLGTLKRISAESGTVEAFTEFREDEWSHRMPHFLPDGKTVLYCVQTGQEFDYDGGQLWTHSIDDGRETHVMDAGCDTRFAAPGELLFVQGTNLNRVPFDASSLEVLGPAQTVVEGITVQFNTGAVQMAVADDGTLVYAPGQLAGRNFDLMRYDREGRSSSLIPLDGVFRGPRVSPDGARVLLQGIGTNLGGIWSADLKGGAIRRMVPRGVRYAWSPDGSRVIYAAGRAGTASRVYTQSADFSGTAQELFVYDSQSGESVSDISADGRLVALEKQGHLGTIATDGTDSWTPFLDSTSQQAGLRFSPDGRFAAYASDESGRFEIYVAEFPGPGGKWQISTEGGTEAIWSRDGSEIFFRRKRRVYAVPVRTDPAFSSGAVQELFLGPYEGTIGQQGFPNYDVSADGKVFYVLESPELQRTQPVLGLFLNGSGSGGAAGR